MQGGVIELAWLAAAAARAERGARGPARLPVRRYRGVMRRDDMYIAEIMDAAGSARCGSGRTRLPRRGAPAAHAGVLPLVGHARMRAPLFGQQPAAGGRGGAPTAHAGVLPLVGHARMCAPLIGQQPAPPQAPAALVGGGAQRQAFSVQQAPAPHFGAPPVPYHGGAAPAFSQFLYRPATGPAFGGAAGGSNGAGFYAAGPALAAAGGSNGAGFHGMAPMIGPEPEVPMPNYAAIRALSSSDKKNNAVVDASAAADPKLVITIESDSDDEAVVEDNFTSNGGASTSSAARPVVPPLRLKDLMEAEVVRRSADEGAL